MKRIALVCLALALVLTAPAVADAKHRAKAKKPADQAVVAKKLAAKVGGAKTAKARAAALLKVMKTVHVQVVSAKGKPLVVSPEGRAARQFALYPFELTALARDYGRGKRLSLDDVAGRLQQLGLGLDATHALPAALLRSSLKSASLGAAAHRHTPKVVLADIVRDLGKKHGYDLAHPPAATKIKLDPVQAFLLEADMVVPYLRELPASGAKASASSVFAQHPAAQGASLSDICTKLQAASDAYDDALAQDDLDKTVNQEFGRGAKGWVAQKGLGYVRGKATGLVSRYVKAVGGRALPGWARGKIRNGAAALKAAEIILDGMQAVTIADSFKATALDQLLKTHWGHDGPGKQMVFRIKVEMLDDLGDTAVKCGKLLGAEIPPKGPVAKVPVAFEQVGTQLTPGDGTWDCAIVCIKKTGGDGIASVTFTPKVEPDPAGVGRQKTNTGNVDGAAFPAQALSSGILSKVFQVAFLHVDGTRWEVTHHEAPHLVLTYDHVGLFDGTSHNSTKYQTYDSKFHKDWHLQASLPLSRTQPGEYAGLGTLHWLKATDTDHTEGTDYQPIGETEDPPVPCSSTADNVLINAHSATAAVPTSYLYTDKTGLHVQSVDFDPGPISELYRYTDTTTSGPCPSGGTSTSDNTGFLNDFGNVHYRERTSTSSSNRTIRITGWTPGSGSVLATKTYTTTDPAGGGTTSYYRDTFQIVEAYDAP